MSVTGKRPEPKAEKIRVAKVLGLARKTYDNLIQNLIWATGCNSPAIPLAAGVAAPWECCLRRRSGRVHHVRQHRHRRNQRQIAGAT